MAQLVYRIAELSQVVGLSKTTIYDLLRKGDFPLPVQLTAKSVGWRTSDVEKWLQERPTAPPKGVSEL